MLNNIAVSDLTKTPVMLPGNRLYLGQMNRESDRKVNLKIKLAEVGCVVSKEADITAKV